MTNKVPLRVDLAGGWLDVPSKARPDGIIVNCAISPMVGKDDWPYRIGGGLGGSAANAILNGKDPFKSELGMGVGWQDPAIIIETGLCAWRSGKQPSLIIKRNGSMLEGRMAIFWTGQRHYTPGLVDKYRNYDAIADSGKIGLAGLESESIESIWCAIRQYYAVQVCEGMVELPDHEAEAYKYCGGGWGGYALYVFRDRKRRDRFAASSKDAIAVEPYYASPLQRNHE